MKFTRFRLRNPFYPGALFKNNVSGASYLPEPISAYNTSGQADFGDSIAAILDTKNGTPVLGPELVVNGDFAAGSAGWTLGTGWSVSNGTAVKTAGTAAGLDRAVSLVAGRAYEVRADITRSAGTLTLQFIGGTAQSGSGVTVSGSVRQVIRAVAGNVTFRALGDATFTGTIDNISVREVPGIPARQPSASLRPLLGRAPKSRRNLLVNSLFDDPWVDISATSIVVSEPPPLDGEAVRAIVLNSGEINGGVPGRRLLIGSIPLLPWALSFHVKPYNGGDIAAAHFRLSALDAHFYFRFSDLSVHGGNHPSFGLVTASIEELENGWFKCEILVPNPSLMPTEISISSSTVFGTSTYARVHSGDGVSGVLASAPQFEYAPSVSSYQRNVGPADMIEAGVQSYPFIRFDLSDDRLDTVLPQAVTGDVVIAGRNGSVITPHSYAANTTFQLGPTSYTGGTPGILRAIGDVVGWQFIDKTMTPAERERLMRFYKRRGAKGLLVEGPNLVTNGSFDTDATGWLPFVGATLSVVGGALSIVSGGQQSEARQQINTVAGKWHRLVADFINVSSRGGISIGSTSGGSEIGIISPIAATSTQSLFFLATGPVSHLTLRVRDPSVGNEARYDNVSVRAFIPEEDW